jgi:prepilin-type N-terminal cleavage/methylation domain-containing protein
MIARERYATPPASAAREGGFTLAELTIVIVVVSIAALFFSGMFVEAVRTYEFVSVEKELLQEARYAEQRMERELMGAAGAAPWRRLRPTSVEFVSRDSSLVEIAWDGARGGSLFLKRDGVGQPLAENVDSFAIRYHGAGGVRAAAAKNRAATDVRRVTLFLRLARGGHSVDAVGAATLRVR